MRNGRQARFIRLVRQRVQIAQILQKIRAPSADGDLVRDAPKADGRVVVILHDQLFQLAAAVFVRCGVGVHRRNKRDFCPHHKARTVARIIKILAVLIMRKAHRICPHLADERNIRLVLLLCQCVALAQTILMARYPAQRREHTVEEKALLRIDRIRAHAKVRAYGVQHFVVHGEQRLGAVQIRILHALPQVHVLDAHLGIGAGGRRAHRACHDLAHRVANDKFNALPVCGIGYKRRKRNNGIAAIHRGGYIKAAAAKIIQIEPGILRHDQIDAAVQSAIKCKIGHLRIHIIARAVVHPDGKQVFTIPQHIRHFGAEQRIAALVERLFHTVHDDPAHAGSGLHLHIDMLALRALNGF